MQILAIDTLFDICTMHCIVLCVCVYSAIHNRSPSCFVHIGSMCGPFVCASCSIRLHSYNRNLFGWTHGNFNRTRCLNNNNTTEKYTLKRVDNRQSNAVGNVVVVIGRCRRHCHLADTIWFWLWSKCWVDVRCGLCGAVNTKLTEAK